MSCYGCSKKYGLFCKEFGCPNCGYSYCSKCLKRPIEVPRHNNKVLNVCLICYDKLNKLQLTEKVIDVDALPGVIVTKVPKLATAALPKSSDIPTILDEETPSVSSDILQPMNTNAEIENSDITENLDVEISKRLKNLKAVEVVPPDEEIRSRLANLTGLPNKNYDKKDLLLSTDERTDEEKMNDLLKQFLGEAAIDKKVETEKTNALSDIERRLKALRDTPIDAPTTSSKQTNIAPNEEEDEETMLKNIMDKYLAEVRLPNAGDESLEAELESSYPIEVNKNPSAADQEELPWCNICNEDAVYRCLGCDGELFCLQCFKECHEDDEEYRNHTKVNYSKPPGLKEDHF